MNDFKDTTDANLVACLKELAFSASHLDAAELLKPDVAPMLREAIARLARPDFGWALRQLDLGHKVARRGWNGKSMWLALSPGSAALPAANFWAGPNRDYALTRPDKVATVLPCITMKTATGEILMGWLASGTDMLAVDWMVVP